MPSWPITFRDKRPEKPAIGDAWWYKPEEEGGEDYHPRSFMLPRLSKAWEASGRDPIMVVLPDGYEFCIDWAWWHDGVVNPERTGWTVTLHTPPIPGQHLHVTLLPSVNSPPWHGWINDGVMSNA
jgi:hypothetical protein